MQLDCRAIGGQCVVLAMDSITAACNVRSCTGMSVAPSVCEEDRATGCNSSAAYTSVDCARSGQACQIVGPRTVCAGTGPACASWEKITCVGSVATYCSGGARATLDCASTGFATRCAEGAPSSEPCTTAATECDPRSFVEKCNGGNLQVCSNGSIVSVSCQSAGLVSCDPSPAGYARCREGV